jgi:hypothetical protein
MKDRKLIAALAVRNQGSRLYGKPLQNLDVESGTTVLAISWRALGRLSVSMRLYWELRRA